VKWSIAESYLFLLRFEFVMAFRTLRSLHSHLKEAVANTPRSRHLATTEELCHAMDLACVFYPKRVLCLQRSAATALLLRWHGIPAEMVIGAKMMPFRSHAWVEVSGEVVNDKPYMPEIYQVLERC
jgi:Transglutaminase-like superfamily